MKGFKALQDEGIEPELEMKLDQLFGVSVLNERIVTERSLKDMEIMNLEARNLADSSVSLADSSAKLFSMPDLVFGSPEFCFACTLIEDPQKRIIVYGMPDDYSRSQWLKYLYQKSEKNE
ncbi:hypothetical protein POM88_020361 [Heracleum sosnowskyi]|uniref:Uncharacterized protein n=1 Tax=Heracleum sosnowskyi TaxID=360622 RepID=A0AAD8IBS3_9APIA|nr:hypothetical protein POM88_020361 [Heracleum sosnowskyi]